MSRMLQRLAALPRGIAHHPLITELCRGLEVRAYLEIGVQEGKSLSAALDAGTIVHLTLIDPWGETHGGTGRGSDAHIRAMLKGRRYTGMLEIYSAYSGEVLPVLCGGRRRYDLIHVDGDHTYEGAYLDIIACQVLTDLMLVHDADWPDVHAAIERFLVGSPEWHHYRVPAPPGTRLTESTAVLWREV